MKPTKPGGGGPSRVRRGPASPLFSAPSLAYRCRNDGRRTAQTLTGAVAEISGYEPADFSAGRIHWVDLIHPEDAPWVDEQVQEALHERHPFQLEYRIRRRDGSERWVWEQGQGDRDGADEPPILQGFIADVTEYKRQGEDLAAANQRLDAHMDNSPLAVVELDAELRIRRWSDCAADVFGWTAAEVLGRGIDELPWVHRDDVEGVLEVMADMLESRRSRNRIVSRSYRKGGGVVRCEWYNSAIYDTDGRLTSILAQILDITERGRAEQDLAQARRMAEERAAELDTVLQAAPVAVWIAYGPEARTIWGNRTAAEWLRLPYGAESSLTAFEGERPTHFRVRQNGRELSGEELPVQRAARGIEVRNFEEEIVFSDGSVRYGLGNATPLLDGEGQPRGAVAAFVDITERKCAEAALLASEERLRLAFEAAYLISFEWDIERDEVRRSISTSPALEPTPEQAPVRFASVLEVVHRNDRALFAANVQAALEREDGRYESEFRIVNPDGSVSWLFERGRVERDAQGRALRLVGLSQDITERKQGEEALRKSQADLNRAQAVGHIGSWRLDIRSDQLTWSAENHRIFGVPEGAPPLSYAAFLSAVHPDDRAYVDRMWQAALGGEPYDIEHRLVVDGKVKWVRELAELERDADGDLIGAFGTTQDITDLKEAQERLLEADRRKDEFLATLAHELRNPLAPIRNAAEILKLVELPDPSARAARDMIERQVQYMVRLVDDLMDVSRITRGKLLLRRERVELGGVLKEAVESAGPRVESAGHVLTWSLPTAPVHLDADPVRLAQIFVNLLDNACKYTEAGGRISLGAEVVGEEVEVRVTDTGIGVSSEDLPRLFDMFEQVGQTPGKVRSGLGIGLSLARGLVEMHGGGIEASSEGSGKGTEFRVRLPILTTAPETAAPPAERREEPRPSQARRILVVDDSSDVAESLAVYLRITGNEVQTAHDGLKAIEAAERFGPEVVLLDIGMPNLDGYEACRAIRARPWGQAMVIVALSGRGQDDDRRRSKEAGFDAHLVKPVDLATIQQLLVDPRAFQG